MPKKDKQVIDQPKVRIYSDFCCDIDYQDYLADNQ
jgi:hypothetical protein